MARFLRVRGVAVFGSYSVFCVRTGFIAASETHLATRLRSGDWRLKKLHRQILLSSTYQTRSRPDGNEPEAEWAQLLETDPENRWLARFPRRRLAAESIRDTMFAVSGTLNHHAGGPGVMPPLPEELTQTLLKGQWKATDVEADHYRRSIYVFARRNLRYPLFATFDRPAANGSCAVRHESTTAIQSLLLLNSRITLDASERLAAKVMEEASGDEARVVAAFRRVLSREPEQEELADAVAFLREQSELLQAEGSEEAKQAALTNLARALFNSNAFLYVD